MGTLWKEKSCGFEEEEQKLYRRKIRYVALHEASALQGSASIVRWLGT
jgi:hypothetical protein